MKIVRLITSEKRFQYMRKQRIGLFMLLSQTLPLFDNKFQLSCFLLIITSSLHARHLSFYGF